MLFLIKIELYNVFFWKSTSAQFPHCGEESKTNISGYIALLLCLIYVRKPCVKRQNDVFQILHSIIVITNTEGGNAPDGDN